MANEPIYIGGLLRCCVQTLVQRDEPGTVGEVVICTVGIGCEGRMILREDGWHWLPHNEEANR